MGLQFAFPVVEFTPRFPTKGASTPDILFYDAHPRNSCVEKSITTSEIFSLEKAPFTSLTQVDVVSTRVHSGEPTALLFGYSLFRFLLVKVFLRSRRRFDGSTGESWEIF